ncbi:hypothetical protein VNI00_011233 [Paramarasmius palmivorus]|uniref:Uncharacterized protein n=1 Tax=Paramarasmius palmivorus TaxID=297713 RepID=A0AAW0CEC9_9AGAR
MSQLRPSSRPDNQRFHQPTPVLSTMDDVVGYSNLLGLPVWGELYQRREVFGVSTRSVLCCWWDFAILPMHRVHVGVVREA